MDIRADLVETAGKLWHTLSDGGPQTLVELKKRLNGQGELLNFAVGWLAREDKIDITREKKGLRIRLR